MQEGVIEGFRLSPQQRRLWLLQRRGATCCGQCAISLEGNLNRKALSEALRRIVSRHEILRTSFHSLSGMDFPLQVISETASISSTEVDCSDYQLGERATLVERILEQERGVAFDLDHSPVMRCVLLRFAAKLHVLLISLPSLCADGETLRNLVSEISRSYSVRPNNRELSDELVQYADFSEWQNELQQSDEAKSARDYWDRKIGNPEKELVLPCERRPFGDPGFTLACYRLGLDSAITHSAKSLADESGTSISCLLLACLQTLLYRLTGQAEITVGRLYNGRKFQQIRNAVGLFEKYLPFLCRFERYYEFKEILGAVDATERENYAKQDYFSWDDSASSIESGQLFLPIKFDFCSLPLKNAVDDLRFSVYGLYSCIDRFKLRLHCIATGDALAVEFQYDPGFYSSVTVERLAGQFDALLRSVVENPSLEIGELNVLSEAEKRSLLVEWNSTELDYPKGTCLHDLFERQVEKTPDCLAVAFHHDHLSYSELNRRANQLAHHLREIGVGPDFPVGLCVERSVEMIAALLAILKAGGAYLPIDVTQPKQRTGHMLKAAAVTTIVTQERFQSLFGDQHREIVCIDSDWSQISERGEGNAERRAFPENLAYVIFTSGSTGVPKGVMIQHESAVSLGMALRARVYNELGGALRVGLNAPLVFDASVKQILQLVFGHALILMPEQARVDAQEMLRFIECNSLDVIDATPSQIMMMREPGLSAKNVAARAVIVGGEAIHERLWRDMVDDPSRVYFNVYGPTECTVDATISTVSCQEGRPTIGSPIPNVRVYVLDDDLGPAPLGVQGELYIAGAGLARGYVNGPDLTAERFLPNAFGNRHGGRLYRAGDAVRYGEDGRIEYIGRKDNQVKVRGHRIELGEIESLLAEHAGVRKAIVLAREDNEGDKRLVAYVVPLRERLSFIDRSPQHRPPNGMSIAHQDKNETDYLGHEIFDNRLQAQHGATLPEGAVPSSAELRIYLKARLPEYMVPSAFLLLEELPLTRNGKIDRSALSKRSLTEYEAAPGLPYVAPQTIAEHTIALVWQEVLGLDKVGINDNFFDIGGHSLLLIRVHNKLQEEFGNKLPLMELFGYPTINSLAAHLSNNQSDLPYPRQSHARAELRRERMKAGRRQR